MTTAIKTNGIGQRTTSHLNLKRTLADVWAEKPKRVVYASSNRWYPKRPSPKIPYAGKDR